MQERIDEILWPGNPRRGSLTVEPYQVGIVVCDGKVVDVFSEGSQRLPKGEIRTHVASTASFRLVFWLKDPSDHGKLGEGVALDQPVLTADGQLVTGQIALTLSVNPGPRRAIASTARAARRGHHEARHRRDCQGRTAGQGAGSGHWKTRFRRPTGQRSPSQRDV